MTLNVKIVPVENKPDYFYVEIKARGKETIAGEVEKSNVRQVIGTLDNAIV